MLPTVAASAARLTLNGLFPDDTLEFPNLCARFNRVAALRRNIH
jgi:hypothetical protein